MPCRRCLLWAIDVRRGARIWSTRSTRKILRLAAHRRPQRSLKTRLCLVSRWKVWLEITNQLEQVIVARRPVIRGHDGESSHPPKISLRSRLVGRNRLWQRRDHCKNNRLSLPTKWLAVVHWVSRCYRKVHPLAWCRCHRWGKIPSLQHRLKSLTRRRCFAGLKVESNRRRG